MNAMVQLDEVCVTAQAVGLGFFGSARRPVGSSWPVWWWVMGVGHGIFQCSLLMKEESFQCVAKVLEEVPPVSGLLSRWRTLARPVGIGPAPIPTDDVHPWMGSQPCCQGRSLSIW